MFWRACATARCSVGVAFAVGELVAGGEEGLLGCGERHASGHVVGGGEAGTAVEDRLVAVGVVPFGGGLADQAAHADGVAVFVDPFAEARPFAQECFVRDFDRGFAGDRVVVGDEQPVREVAVDDCRRDGGELFGGGAAAEVVVVVAGRDELGEQAAHAGLGVGVHLGVELFGAGGERTADAAELGVLARGDRGAGRVVRRAR